jgi:hypothetical protein
MHGAHQTASHEPGRRVCKVHDGIPRHAAPIPFAATVAAKECSMTHLALPTQMEAAAGRLCAQLPNSIGVKLQFVKNYQLRHNASETTMSSESKCPFHGAGTQPAPRVPDPTPTGGLTR